MPFPVQIYSSSNETKGNYVDQDGAYHVSSKPRGVSADVGLAFAGVSESIFKSLTWQRYACWLINC